MYSPVPLNWSVLNSQDQKMRGTLGIPDHESIILLTGCGYPIEDTTVPVSTRRPVDKVLVVHEF